MGSIAGANALSFLKGQPLERKYQKQNTAFYFSGLDTVIYSAGQIEVRKESLTDYAVERGMHYQEFRDASAGTYEKYIYHKEALIGAILIGCPDKIARVNARLQE